VYVDCRLDNYNMDFSKAERRITPRTKVLLVQHTFGMPADLDAALTLARRHRLEVMVVTDDPDLAAHASIPDGVCLAVGSAYDTPPRQAGCSITC
jgi:dTDP-4-amino-4,6-dideoxygalactose transaminase